MAFFKRGFLEIISEILTALADGPLIKTHITFRCNLDSRAVGKYLKILHSYGLIIKVKDSSKFAIAEKGKNYLKCYHELIGSLDLSSTKDLYDGGSKKSIEKIKVQLKNS